MQTGRYQLHITFDSISYMHTAYCKNCLTANSDSKGCDTCNEGYAGEPQCCQCAPDFVEEDGKCGSYIASISNTVDREIFVVSY